MEGGAEHAWTEQNDFRGPCGQNSIPAPYSSLIGQFPDWDSACIFIFLSFLFSLFVLLFSKTVFLFKIT